MWIFCVLQEMKKNKPNCVGHYMIEYIFKVREFHMIFTFYSLLQLCPPQIVVFHKSCIKVKTLHTVSLTNKLNHLIG